MTHPASLKMSMTLLRSWRLELAFISLVPGCLAGQAAPRPDPVPFTRLTTYALEVDAPFGRRRARLGKQRLETRVVAGAVARLNPAAEGTETPHGGRCRGRRASHRPTRQPTCDGECRTPDNSRAWPASVRARAGAL